MKVHGWRPSAGYFEAFRGCSSPGESEELDLTATYKRCPDAHDRQPWCAAGYPKPISCQGDGMPSFLEEIQEARRP